MAGDSEWPTGEPISAATCTAHGEPSSWLRGEPEHLSRAGRRPGGVDVGLVLLARHGEGVPALLVGEHVVEVLARHVVGQAGHSGSPTLGFGAGLSAARIDSRPGLAIGVGGSPAFWYVFQ